MRIADRICGQLEGYSCAVVMDIEELLTEVLTRADEMAVFHEIDRRIFCCHICGYWQPQNQNATPDAQEWVCKECHKDEA